MREKLRRVEFVMMPWASGVCRKDGSWTLRACSSDWSSRGVGCKCWRDGGQMVVKMFFVSWSKAEMYGCVLGQVQICCWSSSVDLHRTQVELALGSIVLR